MSNLMTRSLLAARPATLILGMAAFLAAASIPSTRSYAQASQRAFATPQAAVDALVAAVKAHDPASAVVPVLGPAGEKILSSGDQVEDAKARNRFLSAYNQMHRLAYDTDGRVILYVGADNWPLPIPLVKKQDRWEFDTAAGQEEMVYRRIGANELYTIDVLENLVEAQEEYAAQARERTGLAQYAQKVLSDEGQRNGLYWPAAAGVPESPIGPLIAKAISEGYRKGQAGKPVPFHGYIYRVLTAQGKNAPGGALGYIRDGRMTAGFAFLAYPATYRSSGVMTFVVNQNGDVHQKNLGPDTSRLAKEIKSYNPDSSWKATSTSEPQEIPPEQADLTSTQSQ